MQFRRPSRRNLVSLFSVFAFVCVLPEVFAFISHVFYGSNVQVGNATVPVPYQWIIYKKAGTLVTGRFSIIRFHMVAGAFFSHSMLITKSPEGAFPHDKWKEISMKDMFDGGFIFQRERKLSFASREGYCLEFSAIKDAEHWKIYCEIPPLELHVFFQGQQSFVEQFYGFLQQAKFKGPAKSPSSASPRA